MGEEYKRNCVWGTAAEAIVEASKSRNNFDMCTVLYTND